MRKRWRRKSNKQPTLSRWKWSKKTFPLLRPLHSRQSAMHRHRSVCACAPTLTRSLSLLGCYCPAQATPPSLLATAVNWVSALFITYRLLLLPVAAAPGCLLSGCKPHPSSHAWKQFAPTARSRFGRCVLLDSEIAAAKRLLLLSTPKTPASHGDPKPQRLIHMTWQYMHARRRLWSSSAWRSSAIANSALVAHLGCSRI